MSILQQNETETFRVVQMKKPILLSFPDFAGELWAY